MSQNLTLTAKDIIDIERIKPLLEENKSQIEISVALGLRRETINRKIHKWIQTSDFRLWIKTSYLSKLGKVSDEEALRSLTRLMVEVLRQEQGHPQEKPNTISFRWLTEKEWNDKLQSNTIHIVGKENFTKAKQGSAACPLVEDGEKPDAAQTSS